MMKRILVLAVVSVILSGCAKDPIDACVEDVVGMAQNKTSNGACKGLEAPAVQEVMRRTNERYPNLKVTVEQIEKNSDPVPIKKPAPPPKFYALKEGQDYGYEQSVSEEAKRQGQVASKLLLFKFIGEREGLLQFMMKDGNVFAVVQCERPCEFVKQMVFFDQKMLRKELMRANEGSIIWAVTRDGMNGYLQPYIRERNGKKEEVWFEETGPKWRPI